MGKIEELKRLLTIIKKNEWKVPDDIDINELTFIMLKNIGSLDEELRDYLILEMFENIIEKSKISYDQMKKLLNLCLTSNHLFYGLGKEHDDSVFNRTFTMLVIGNIVNANNSAEKKFLNKEEVLVVYRKVMEYCTKEIDFRGYVDGKGWAHSTAHASDTLSALAQSEYIGHDELMGILRTIKDKICIDIYTYINREEERLTNAFMYSYYRNLIKNEEIINWIYCFQDAESSDKAPNREHLRENRKKFFIALYFRTRRYKVDYEIIKAIEDVLKDYQQAYIDFNHEIR